MCPALLSRSFLVALLALSSSFSSLAGAEIFRCMAKNGLPLYQNFPCQFDSLNLTGSASVAKPASDYRAAPAAVQSATLSASPRQPHTGATEPAPGMTSDEIWTMLGQPMEIVSNHATGQGSAETWRYADKRIQFDDNNVVVAIQW